MIQEQQREQVNKRCQQAEPLPLVKFTSKNKFPEFDQALRAHLASVQCASRTPLLYVLRDEANGTDTHIYSKVGPGNTFEFWDEYLIGCTTHNKGDKFKGISHYCGSNGSEDW